MKIRTRYAPSPTGRMHVGNLRTALYAYLIARHEGGDFLLRIEDTDQERYVEGATEIIYQTLKDAGLNHDEGPDKDGGCGPYVQSERVKAGIYTKYAKELIDKGEAYYCFCTPERLQSLTQTVGGTSPSAEDGEEDEGENAKSIRVYDKHCLSLSEEEVKENLAKGMPHVIRQNNPTEGTTTFHDELYGDVTVDNSELDDMILIKSDGYPTYNFANVVDDHLMGITHVVRGNEYISSTPKYNRLYEAFGWEIPAYIHCPLITDEEHHKLSKRSGHSSFEDLLEQGFLPEAVVNFVALLGWSPENNAEVMSLSEMIAGFDYRRISKSPAVFDFTKLKWMNGEYFKAMEEEVFFAKARDILKQALPAIAESPDGEARLKKIAAMVKTRIEVFPDIAPMVEFFREMPAFDNALYTHKKMKTDAESAKTVLSELLPVLKEQEDYSNDALFARLKAFVEEKGYKNGYVLWPLRIAVTGKEMTPCGATEAMEVLGKDETLSRLEASLEKL
ncbi:MAG: glutamate--tRNA ligase [Lachnospiraceae bacterium]|nr:glutamate--tRNA ligase [Lachnospiraceae bacterium]